MYRGGDGQMHTGLYRGGGGGGKNKAFLGGLNKGRAPKGLKSVK